MSIPFHSPASTNADGHKVITTHQPPTGPPTFHLQRHEPTNTWITWAGLIDPFNRRRFFFKHMMCIDKQQMQSIKWLRKWQDFV